MKKERPTDCVSCAAPKNTWGLYCMGCLAHIKDPLQRRKKLLGQCFSCTQEAEYDSDRCAKHERKDFLIGEGPNG